jgi:hypothetical protein
MSTRGLVQQGSRWSVGSGRKIRIWKGNWLTTLSSFKVCSVVSVLEEEAIASDLIDMDLRKWEKNLINNFLIHLRLKLFPAFLCP